MPFKAGAPPDAAADPETKKDDTTWASAVSTRNCTG